MIDPTQRFSARADVYARARPSYPKATIALLALDPGAVVADVGSGTGIFSRLLLDAGAVVRAVEPNTDMRAEAERALGAHPRFRSVAGRAEAMLLEPASVDLVTAAQAYHWFDADRFHAEANRILKPGGRVALVWNDRALSGPPFLAEYEAILLEHCPGYHDLQGKSETPDKFDRLFETWSRQTTPNEQALDREGLYARVMSASYAPKTDEGRAKLTQALDAAFDRHVEKGVVTIAYSTVVISGPPQRGRTA